MNLPPEAIDEFMEIYQNEFEKPLDREKAEELAENLIRVFTLVFDCQNTKINASSPHKK